MKYRDLSNFPKGTLFLLLLLIAHDKATSEPIRDEVSNEFTSNNDLWKEEDKSPHNIMKESNYFHVNGQSRDSDHCARSAKCVKLENSTCMGRTLPYSFTSLDQIPGHTTQEMIGERLHLLQGLVHIPKCWALVRPFLCSFFMPECSNNTIHLLSPDKCRKVTSLCRLIINETIWPSFIKCDNEELFPRQCINNKKDEKMQQGTCLEPLIQINDTIGVFDGIDGCGKPCENPLYTPDEHKEIHSFVAWGAGICGAFNLFTIVTFLIDWRSANKYPAVVIFYINCCFFVSCIGWFIQFIDGNRELITCRKNKTTRISEPSSGETLCVVVFILVYSSLMAATVWFVILAYAWHMSFQAVGKIQDKKIDRKGSFHVIAWSIPFALTVIIIAISEVDGNSVTGICFVGYANHVVRAWFLLAPILAGVIVGGYFISRSLFRLINVKISSQEVVSKHASEKIRRFLVRMGVFSFLTFVAVGITFYCHYYEFKNSRQWNQSFRNYIVCLIVTKYADESECKLESKPSVTKLQLHLLALFSTGILMSSWIWTESTVETWKRFFRRTFSKETEEPLKIKKHKVIAQAFAKRKTFNNAGRLSLSFYHTHEDPVGWNFDLNSVASQDFSSTWAAALPKFVTRRGALVGGNPSVSSNRRNSVGSEVSFSVRRVSVESRRNSLDSQISVQIAELKTTTTRKVASNTSGTRGNRRGKRRRDFGKSRSTKMGPLFRRGSTTSQESQLNAQILSAITQGDVTTTISRLPNMERRSATAGLDDKSLILNNIDGKTNNMLLPFLFHNNRSDTDENLSSEEKNNDKIIDIEACNNEKKNEGDSDSDSQPDEETKMLDTEEQQERCKSKSSNKSMRSYNRSQEDRKSKYFVQDETVLRHLLQQESKNDKDNYRNKSGIADLESSLTSYCPELSRVVKTDAVSPAINSTNLKNAREMATQTSSPIEQLEIASLTESIEKMINKRNCSSKGTQISPQLNTGQNRKVDIKHTATSPVSVSKSSREGRRSDRNN